MRGAARPFIERNTGFRSVSRDMTADLIPNPGKESDYRGTENCQRNRDDRIPLFLWLLSVSLYPSSVVFPDLV
jgi:hypothetical protein